MKSYRSSNSVLVLGRVKGTKRTRGQYKGRLTLFFENTASTVRVDNTSMPYRAVGFVDTSSGRGSGVVTKHPKLFLSCAHVFSEKGNYSHSWYPSSSITFYPSYDAFSYPNSGGYSVRSYWRFTGYATEARKESSSSSSSARTFSYDFVAAYGYSDLINGGYAGIWGNGASVLASSSTSKMIVGYPAGTAGHYLERTGPFQAPYQSSYRRYRVVYGHSPVDTGGNSGGPVFVYNSGFQSYIVAGVHVSGDDSPRRKGVHAIDSAAHNIINDAINAIPSPLDGASVLFSAPGAVPVPDDSEEWAIASIPVSGLGTRISEISVSLTLEHPDASQLEVWIQSPQGRWEKLHDRVEASGGNLEITDRDLIGHWGGRDPNGTWKVLARDRVAGGEGRLTAASLLILAP